MINANEARKLVENSVTENELAGIYNKIESAAKKGKTFLDLPYISAYAIKALEANGFKVVYHEPYSYHDLDNTIETVAAHYTIHW